MIQFYATGIPKAQPRVRAFAQKIGGKFQARMYDPGTAEAWKGQIALFSNPHRPKEPIQGAIQLTIIFEIPRPKSHFTKKGLRETAPKYHTGKPDADNFAKAVMDALTQLNFWEDDSQVSVLAVTKIYSRDGQTGAEISIQQIQ